MPLSNLRKLCEEMRKADLMIEPFLFTYNGVECFVNVRLIDDEEKVPSWAIAEIIFLKKHNIRERLAGYASRASINIYWKDLFDFFGLNKKGVIQDIFAVFYPLLGSEIPTEIRRRPNKELDYIAIRVGAIHAKEDPNKIHCTAMKKNGAIRPGGPGSVKSL